jgi:hypothetical protein
MTLSGYEGWISFHDPLAVGKDKDVAAGCNAIATI